MLLFPALSFVRAGRLSSVEFVTLELRSRTHVRLQVYRPHCHYPGLHLLLPGESDLEARTTLTHSKPSTLSWSASAGVKTRAVSHLCPYLHSDKPHLLTHTDRPCLKLLRSWDMKKGLNRDGNWKVRKAIKVTSLLSDSPRCADAWHAHCEAARRRKLKTLSVFFELVHWDKAVQWTEEQRADAHEKSGKEIFRESYSSLKTWEHGFCETSLSLCETVEIPR